MSEPIETIEGWYALHDFRRIDWTRWRNLNPSDRRQVVEELSRLTAQYAQVPQDQGSFAIYSILGHKADLLFLHFRPDPKTLGALEQQLDKGLAAAILTRPY